MYLKLKMASLFENFNIPPCVWFEGGDKKNALAAIFAGSLVGDSLSFIFVKLQINIYFIFSLALVGG